jgi:hypothetical protein
MAALHPAIGTAAAIGASALDVLDVLGLPRRLLGDVDGASANQCAASCAGRQFR